jgi:hypothetical protein
MSFDDDPAKKECTQCHKVEAWADFKEVRAIAAGTGWDPAALEK